MIMKVMVCGVDCHQGDTNCNGYCTGKSDDPPAATPEQARDRALSIALELLSKAESAWYDYWCLCEIDTESRAWAHGVHDRLKNVASVPDTK